MIYLLIAYEAQGALALHMAEKPATTYCIVSWNDSCMRGIIVKMGYKITFGYQYETDCIKKILNKKLLTTKKNSIY
jgi:hypothetical protein